MPSPLFTLEPHAPPATFAVCPPLRKPALRRLATAEPAAPPPPPLPLPADDRTPAAQPDPASQTQPASQLRGTVPQAAPGAKQGRRYGPPLWLVKLCAIGVELCLAVSYFRRGWPGCGFVHLFFALVVLMIPT